MTNQLRQGPYDRGIEWPMMLMAISATLIQIAGLIPPYFELAKRSGRVIGIGMQFKKHSRRYPY